MGVHAGARKPKSYLEVCTSARKVQKKLIESYRMSFEKNMIKSEIIQYNWTLGTYRYTRYDVPKDSTFDTRHDCSKNNLGVCISVHESCRLPLQSQFYIL